MDFATAVFISRRVNPHFLKNRIGILPHNDILIGYERCIA